MAIIQGTEGNDDLVSPNARENDIIVALGGNDRIEARGGDDLIYPGLGNDRIEGGDGRDTVRVAGSVDAWEVYRWDNEGLMRGPEGVKTLLDVEGLEFTGNPGTYELSNFNEFFAYTYLASNLDVADALGVNPDAAWDHFRDFGAAEGRTLSFDGNSYLAANLDVLASSDFGANADLGGARHYLVAGRAEGRPTEFAGLSYIASYEDLSSLYGTDKAAGTQHYVQLGANEGRTITFDGLQYVASSTDLLQAFRGEGTGFQIGEAGAAHYITSGRAEGRALDAFNETSYAAANADLTAAGLTTADQLAQHWIEFGFAEGRTGAYDPVIA